ncbi:hypothetical protein ACF0H5_015121 [Mactra antiquata]
MPLTQGKMQIDNERRIKKNLRELKKDMDAKDLVDYFIEKEIFDFPDLEKINGFNPNTTENRNNCFFSLLFQSGNRAYGVFLEALRDHGQQHLAEMIENTELENAAGADANEPDAWINKINPAVKQRRLQEKDLSRLAQTLGNDWESVVLDMGISQVEIDQCKLDNNSTVMKVYAGLNKWRMRKPDLCTLQNFVRIAKSCDQATTIDWQQMKIIAERMS